MNELTVRIHVSRIYPLTGPLILRSFRIILMCSFKPTPFYAMLHYLRHPGRSLVILRCQSNATLRHDTPFSRLSHRLTFWSPGIVLPHSEWNHISAVKHNWLTLPPSVASIFHGGGEGARAPPVEGSGYVIKLYYGWHVSHVFWAIHNFYYKYTLLKFLTLILKVIRCKYESLWWKSDS